MASGERRSGSGRRGMTVLGKIPTPTVPKPINLPSQRLETRGLEPNVELVPRGTFSWGSAGRSSAVAVSKGGGPNNTSSPPTSSVAWNGTLKMQALSAPSNDAGSLADRRPLSASSTRPSSAPPSATATVWGSSAKTKVEMQVPTNALTINPVDPENVLSSRPTSADGTVLDRHADSHSGVDAHSSACSHPGSGSESFQHPGDGYNSQRNHHHLVWQGMPLAGSRELPVVPGPYTAPLPHEVYYNSYGVPQIGNVKDRDMVVVRMVNGPGVYGNFPPHLRPVECFGPPGTHGSYQPAARQVEQFTMSGNSAMGTSSCNPGMSFGFFPDGNKYPVQEGDGQFGAVPRDAVYPSLQRDRDSIHISSVPTYGTEWKHRMQRPFERHNHASGEYGTDTKDGVATFAMPAPEKKITLLTKMPRVEAPGTETIINNSSLLPDSSQGNEGCQQKTEKSIAEVENTSTAFEVKDVKNAGESFGSNKSVGVVAKMTIKETMSEPKSDVVAVSCSRDTVAEVDTGVSKTLNTRSSKTWRKAAGRSDVNGLFSPQKVLPSTTIHDSEWKAQISHHFKSDNDSHGHELSKQGHEGTYSNAISDSSGTGLEAVFTEPTRPGAEENFLSRDDQKTKTKALHHKNEKEWRPKSPVVESKFSGHRVAKGGKRTERGCIADSFKEVSSQDCSTASVVLETPSSSRTQKAGRRRSFKSQESFPCSASTDINFDKEPPLHVIEDPNSSHCQVTESIVQQNGNGETFVLEASYSGAHNAASSDDQVLHADTSKVTITEGLAIKGNHKPKARQSTHKGEREWRPKSPAVDSTVTSDNVSRSQASEANVTLTSVSDIDIKTANELRSSEQGLQPLDMYDYEGQRAKLKEIAAQRAKQRRKEEEERIKERRAKALAKLDELNRRTSTNPASLEVVEHGSMVCLDEAPNRKTQRKFNPPRCPSVDALISDAGGLEKQHIDEMDQVFAIDSMAIAATTTLHKKYLAKIETDTEELASSDVIFPQNSRSNRDESACRNSLKTAEKHQLNKFQTATSRYQEQRQQSRKEKFIAEEDSRSGVHHSEVESFSSKKFGVEMRKDNTRLQRGQRQIDLAQELQTDKAPLMSRNERRGAVEEHHELEPSSLSSDVSQIGDSQGDCRDKGGFPAKRRSQGNSLEGLNQTKAGEWPFSEEHPVALSSFERKIHTNAGGKKQTTGSSRSGQKDRSEIEACLASEEAQGLGVKQSMEYTVSSDSNFVSEKPSNTFVSWRQKNPSHMPNSDKAFNGSNKDMGSVLEESEKTPCQVRKSYKSKNSGGKEHAASQYQGGNVQVEVVEEKRPSIPGSVISEVTALNADLIKHEVEGKDSENVKTVRSNNSRRHKNITNGTYMVKQNSTKEFNERHPESWAAPEAFEEMVDPTHLHAISTSNLHHPLAITRQSLRAGMGAPAWHKHRSMKLSNALSSLGQAGSPVPVEEHSLGEGISVPWNRSRSSIANTQGGETEHSQEAESSQSRKNGAQFQAESALPLEASAQNRKHQQVYSAKGADIAPDQHSNVSSSKNRSNHTHVENRKMNRHYQAGPQAFRPREQHPETVSEGGNHRGEQHGSSRGRDKPSRKSQFNGCSTVAEIDRRGAEPAIKTEISY